MKNSQFNYFLKYDDSHILYNTLSNKLLLLDQTLVDLYKAAKDNKEIDGLSKYHPSFYKKLMDDKFIVADTVDEKEEIRRIMHAIDGDESQYYLIINPTMNCNFKCWYCYESHIKESKMGEQTIHHIVQHLANVLESNKKIKNVTIGWFGGEPLLYFNNVMLPIMQEVDIIAKKHNVHFNQNMTTNGFLIKDKMIPYFQEYNLMSFQITLDGNRFLHDTVRFVSKSRGSYDDIVANIKLLAKNKLPVTTRINYTKTTLKDIEEIYEDFKDLSTEDLKYLDISFHQIWQDKEKNLNDRVDDLVEFFRERGINSFNSYVPNTLFGSCYADKKNHATINYDGNVFKCTARDFNSKNREGVLKDNGEIDWNEKFQNRMEIKLKNKPCHSCGILPLCNGGCSQIAIEANGQDFCVYEYDENVKKDIVYRKVNNILMAMSPN
jgi:uncharacterized protein